MQQMQEHKYNWQDVFLNGTYFRNSYTGKSHLRNSDKIFKCSHLLVPLWQELNPLMVHSFSQTQEISFGQCCNQLKISLFQVPTG